MNRPISYPAKAAAMRTGGIATMRSILLIAAPVNAALAKIAAPLRAASAGGARAHALTAACPSCAISSWPALTEAQAAVTA